MGRKKYLTKNGRCYYTVVIKKDCPPVIKNAADGLSGAIELISGAKPEIVETDSFLKLSCAIVLAQLSDLPFLKGDALAGSDGFIVEEADGNIFIASEKPEGVFYGAHSFIESNAQIIWTRGGEPYRTLYKKQSDIKIKRLSYLQKSPFKIRGWNTCGTGAQGEKKDYGTMLCYAKNKNNCKYFEYDSSYKDIAINPFGVHIEELHDLDGLIAGHPEFFMTAEGGKPKLKNHESYINYYNIGAAKAFADKIIEFINQEPKLLQAVINLHIPDDPYFYMVEGGRVLSEQEFVTDDGNAVSPEEDCYKSTVYFNYINRVINAVCRVHPSAKFITLAYLYAEKAPKTTIHDNLYIGIAPIHTNDHYSYTGDADGLTKAIADNILSWTRLTNNVCLYNYWQCFKGKIYSRPSVKVVKKNLLWYKKIGVSGLIPEGKIDGFDYSGCDNFFDMNEMYYWQMNRLMWDPELDIQDMTKKFCRLAYGRAAKHMLKYYRLIQSGWDKMPAYVFYAVGGDVYIKQFIIKAGIADKVLKSLNAALNVPLTDLQKMRIQPIRDITLREIKKYSKLTDERAEAAYCGAGIDTILSEEHLDLENNSSSVWNSAKKLTVLKNYDTFEDYPAESKFCACLLFDEEYLYVGFRVYDDKIAGAGGQNKFGQPIVIREDGSQLESYTETYIGGNMLNMSKYYGYFSGFMHSRDSQFYENSGSPKAVQKPPAYREKYYVFLDNLPQKRYYFHVQAIAFKDLGVALKDAKPYGSFVYYTDRYGRAGWKGNGLWSKESFSEIFLINREGNKHD